jgi:hypothetical protein
MRNPISGRLVLSSRPIGADEKYKQPDPIVSLILPCMGYFPLYWMISASSISLEEAEERVRNTPTTCPSSIARFSPLSHYKIHSPSMHEDKVNDISRIHPALCSRRNIRHATGSASQHSSFCIGGPVDIVHTAHSPHCPRQPSPCLPPSRSDLSPRLAAGADPF